MKIRNHRKKEYVFRPSQNSELKGIKIFKYKSDLINYLNKTFPECLNGTVSLTESCFGGSHTIRQWEVWYNDYREDNQKIKPVLKQLYFRGGKFISKPWKVSKKDKRYFAFSDKVISTMSDIADSGVTKNKANKLVTLFYKRGFTDFEPTEDDWKYINGHIGDGIDFFHWSDRCNWLRTKTIIEYLKKEKLI